MSILLSSLCFTYMCTGPSNIFTFIEDFKYKRIKKQREKFIRLYKEQGEALSKFDLGKDGGKRQV